MRLRTPPATSRWQRVPAKFAFERAVRRVRPEDGVVTAFRDGEVTLRVNRRTEGFTNALVEHGYQGIRAGDLVIHSMDGFAGAIGVSDSDGKASPVVHAYVSQGADTRFCAYLLRAYAWSGFVTSLGKGIRQRSTAFDEAAFRSLKLPMPPLSQQRSIAEFLDRETERIDAVVAAKRRMIDLLDEERTALITHTVTKGLDPTVPMKDSGIPWLGDIPAHWEAVPNRYVLSHVRRLVGIHSDSYVLLSLTRRGVVPRDTESGKGKYPASFDTYQAVEPGEFVFCLFDVDETPRTVGLSQLHGMVTGAYDIFQVLAGRVPDYFLYLYVSFDIHKRLRPLYRGLRKTLPMESFMSMKVSMPPVAEQEAIASHLTTHETRSRALQDRLTAQLALLAEYRQALITSAVTGRLSESVLRGEVPVEEAVEVSA